MKSTVKLCCRRCGGQGAVQVRAARGGGDDGVQAGVVAELVVE